MVEWSKDHMAAIGPLNSKLWFNCWNLVKLKVERGHQGKAEITSWEGRGVDT
jgi:hypothetical protein